MTNAINSPKLDILLTQPAHIQSRQFKYHGRELPLGLAYLAAYLKLKGFSVQILDLNIRPEPRETFQKALKELKPTVIGISSFTADINEAHKLATLAKKQIPELITLIGGIHASIIPENTLRSFPDFDLLIHGQGEKPLTELLCCIKNGSDYKDIPGLGYRIGNTVKINPKNKDIIPLSELPFPARDKLELDKYSPHMQKYISLPNTGLISSIGCPYKCSYCSVNSCFDNFYSREPENVISEIINCIDNYGIHDFRFFDDCITIKRDNLMKLCNLILENRLKIHWFCQSRVDKVDLPLLKLMKRSGCFQVTYGVETGSAKTLHTLNKQTTLQQAEMAIKNTKKAGLECGASFILGVPGESIEEMKETINFAKKLSPDIAQFYIMKAYPGTKFFKSEDIIHENWQNYQMHSLPTIDTGVAPEEISRMIKKAYRAFYFRPAYFLQRIIKMFKNPYRELKISINGAFIIARYFLPQKK